MLITKKNILIAGSHGRPMGLDLYYTDDPGKMPIVIFAHGFKGFKDWGHWHLFAEAFAEAGYLFLKFNFSCNGTTPDKPEVFKDLNAFGRNNYSIELNDLDRIITWILEEQQYPDLNIDRDNVTLIGHSRGGGVSIVKAATDKRIHKLMLWASVSSLAFAWKDNLELVEKWRNDGVYYIMNGRTKQEMPLFFQLYEDYQENEAAYNVENACRNVDQPVLILQGENDPAVPVSEARNLKQWLKNARLEIIPGGDHVFGGRHPYTEKTLPEHSQLLLEHSLDFLKE